LIIRENDRLKVEKGVLWKKKGTFLLSSYETTLLKAKIREKALLQYRAMKGGEALLTPTGRGINCFSLGHSSKTYLQYVIQ